VPTSPTENVLADAAVMDRAMMLARSINGIRDFFAMLDVWLLSVDY